jgi:hypothetical protein
MCFDLTEEMQREEDVNIAVEYSDMKSETHLKFELTKAISISREKPKSGQSDKIFSTLKIKMSLYEVTCTLTPNLKMLLGALLTIWPTSRQNKIKFSTSGIFVTKQILRLSGRAINALCVLKFYFRNDNF